MTPPKVSQYIAPRSLEEFWQHFLSLRPMPVLLAGGTEVVKYQVKGDDAPARAWLDLTTIPELNGIEERDGKLWVGATSTYTEIANHPLVQKYAGALAIAARTYATWQVRNRATIGGLLSQGNCEADILPALCALRARIFCSNGKEERQLICEDLYGSPPDMTLQEREIVTGIDFPLIERESVFMKASSQELRAPAKVSVAIALAFKDDCYKEVRIALGSTGSTLIRATAAEGLLEGQPTDHPPLLQRVAYEVRRIAKPTSDKLSNARYRKWKIGILTLQALQQLLEIYQKNALVNPHELIAETRELPQVQNATPEELAQMLERERERETVEIEKKHDL